MILSLFFLGCNPNKIDWMSHQCPNYIMASIPNAQCALMEVPLDYNKPDGEKIEIFAYRVLGDNTEGKNHGQIVFLQGGPGGTGAVFASLFKEYRKKYPYFDFYSLDHRGVGNSIDLKCKNEDKLTTPKDFQTCVEELESKWGEKLKQFSATNAAKDLNSLFTGIKKGDTKQFIYAVSYGTYWAERYLYFYPNKISGVVLDSIASINNTWMDDYNLSFFTVGNHFMEICEQDSICKNKLSPYGRTPKIALDNFYKKVDDNISCDLGYGFSSNSWKSIFGASLKNYYSRVLIPSLLYRLHRCKDTDKAIINKYVGNMSSLGFSFKEWVDPESLNSDILYYNIVFSELWKGNSLEDIREIENNSLFLSGSMEPTYQAYTNGNWKTYQDDGSFRKFPNNSKIPILMLNGDLDPQTSLEMAYPSKEVFNKTNQEFIMFPQSSHGVIVNSLMNDLETSCGEIVIFNFFEHPTKKVDRSCMSDIQKISSSKDASFNVISSSYFFGTDDMWEGKLTKKKKIDKKMEEKIRKSSKFSFK